MEYKISKKFGKGIVDGEGKQVAWVDDYVMAKRICMFLNGGGCVDYPEYVSVGGDCYELKGDLYFSVRLGISLDFTVSGVRMYSVSSFSERDGRVMEEVDYVEWFRDNGDYV